MKRIFNPCRKYREALCAAMSGDLPAADRSALEQHLATCAGCQKYRDEIGNVTTLLSASHKLFADVQPGETAQAHWARDFESATKSDHSIATKVFHSVLNWCRDMVLPCRWIWAGMVAVWLVVLGLNVSQRASEETQIAHRPSPEMMRALLALEGFLPDTRKEREANPPRRPAPQPRTEQHPDSKPS